MKRLVLFIVLLIASSIFVFGAPNIVGSCVDDDGGENSFVAGTACYSEVQDSFDSLKQKCTGRGAYVSDNCNVMGYDSQGHPTYSVGETYCMSDGSFDRKYISCSGGCENGACIQEASQTQQLQPQLIKCSGGRGIFNNEEEIYDDLWKSCPNEQALKSSLSLDLLRSNPSARYYECTGASKSYYAVTCVAPIPQQPQPTQPVQTPLAQICKSTNGWWSEQAEAPYWKARWCDCGNKEWKPDQGGCVYPGQTLISPDEQLCRSTGGRWTPGITYAPTRDDKGASFGIQGIPTSCDCGSKVWTRNGCAVLAPPKIGSPTWSTEPPKFGVIVTEPREPATNQQWSSTPKPPATKTPQEPVKPAQPQTSPENPKIVPSKPQEQTLVIPQPIPQEQTQISKAVCKDEDGEDVFRKSFVEGFYDDNVPFKHWDECLSKDVLHERVCINNQPRLKNVFCNCLNDVCVKKEPVKPEEPLPKDHPKIVPKTNKSCKDSDGLNSNSAGYVLITNNDDLRSWYDDACLDAKTVLERSCNENNDLVNQSVKCEFGCAEGRCHPEKRSPQDVPVEQGSGFELLKKAYLNVQGTGKVVEFDASIKLDEKYKVKYNVTGLRGWSFNPFTADGVRREQLAIGVGNDQRYYDKPTFDEAYKVLKIRILPARPYEQEYELRGVSDKFGCTNDFKLIFNKPFEPSKQENVNNLLVRDGRNVCKYEFYNKLISKLEFNKASVEFSTKQYGKINVDVPIRCIVKNPVQIFKEDKSENKKSDKNMLDELKSYNSPFNSLGSTKYRIIKDAESRSYLASEMIMQLDCYYGPFDVVNYRNCGKDTRVEHIAYDVKGKVEKESRIGSCEFSQTKPACFEMIEKNSELLVNQFNDCFWKEFKYYWEDEAREHVKVMIDCKDMVRQACTNNPLFATTPVGRGACMAALVGCGIIDATSFMGCYDKATRKEYDYHKSDCKRFGVQEEIYTILDQSYKHPGLK